MSEHYRPVSGRTDTRELAQGYWCARCGEGGLNMLGHHAAVCEPNPELVHLLQIVNSPTWVSDQLEIARKKKTPRLADELLP